ncbi:putative secreted protein (Por secretion system target) [Lutibacter sp. Hel_I_33_5]|uniref:leucine-rich repeat protein n=1 Tax=Lutibacter sp. Hel_I_33_5 TaxID=1566289 RepID=UPI0011A7B8D9|nr:leucine-rich repeat protein [Lutibacter sp. Hel_I_33_5]TVZ55946.1 putative secreted protein (Por secretion system target) [Lutibacter sp. Hel_I_33_5]
MKQNNNLRIFLLFATLFFSISFTKAQTFTKDGISYNVIDVVNSYVEVTSGCMANVSIPSTISNNEITYTVTNIGYSAFSTCYDLISIDIPSSVTSIGDRAFNSCNYLNSINIPNSVTSIGNMAFSACYRLTSINIPNSVTSIGDYAFANSIRLTTVSIPNSITSIGEWVFGNCSGLISVTIPSSVTSIGDSAFNSCYKLTDINISNSITSIGNKAFAHCWDLSSFTIPNSVTSIGDFAFLGCEKLTEITAFPETPIVIDANVYEDVIQNNVTLKVSCASLDSYKTAEVWKNFKVESTTNMPNAEATQSFGNDKTLADIIITGENIKWYDALTAGNLLNSTTALVNNATYYASQTKNDCESTLRTAVSVNTTLNVEKLSVLAFETYPNPSTGIFKIKLTNLDEDVKFNLFDITGKQIETKTIHNKPETIIGNTNLSNGIYLLEIIYNNSKTTKKLIVSK